MASELPDMIMSALRDAVGGSLARRLEELTLELYGAAARHAQSRGIIIEENSWNCGGLSTATGPNPCLCVKSFRVETTTISNPCRSAGEASCLLTTKINGRA